MYHDPRNARRVEFERAEMAARVQREANARYVAELLARRRREELAEHPELDTDDRELDARRED